MDKRETDQFDLDEILKEFSEEDLEEISVDFDGPILDTEEEPRDTIRLDAIQKAVKSASVTDDTLPFQPLDEPAAEHEPEASAEPFARQWEPTFEETMQETFPVQPPIVFRPKNRLRELRQKLVEGPERRYYALSEVGTAKLQAAIFLHALLLLVALGGVLIYAMNLIPVDRVRMMIFLQLLVMLLSGLLGCYRMMEGIGSVLRGRFTQKSLLFIIFLACCVDGLRCLSSLQMPGCAVFCLQMLMVQLSELQKRESEMAMMDTLRKATNLYSVAKFPDYHEGQPGYGVGEGQVEDFMDHYQKVSAPERALNIFSGISVLASLAIGVLAGMHFGTDAGIRFGTAALLAAAPAGAFFSMSRPMAVLEKRLRKVGTVLCGWHGIRREKKSAFFPLTHEDLFPVGSVKLNGVKFFGNVDTDAVVAYTASLIAKDGSSLAPLFVQMMEGRGGYKFHVDHFRAYENGGIGGELAGESVLVGTLTFMRQMGVEMPQGTRVANAVYTAVDGTLCAVFALSYSRTKGTAAAIQALCGCSKLTPVLVGNDFVLTESFLRSKFRARTRRMAFPAREVRDALAAKQLPEEVTVVGLSVREGLVSKAFAVSGARVLRSALQAGAAVHIFAGVLGMALIAALAYVGAESLISPQNLLLYSLLWLIPGWLITEWTRQL